jgi:Tol biopolymer transport system component
MHRTLRLAETISLAFLAAACGGPGGSPILSAVPSPAASAPAPSPTRGPAASPAATLDASKVPPGLIAYMRVDAGNIERYFVVDTLGANEVPLFETQGCACIRWSPDGTKLWTVAETDTGLRFKTIDPDGGNPGVLVPEIKTLNLVPGFGSADGLRVGFFGWDDTDPSRTGLWVAGTDLSELHQVSTTPDGTVGIEPIGMSHDGSFVYFLGDVGTNTENDFKHAGNVYVVGSDGTGLRQLNPPGTMTEVTGAGVSADGRRFAFTAWEIGSADEGNALFIVDGPKAEAMRVTDWTASTWGASWSPDGEWIGSSTLFHRTGLLSIVKPDGTGGREVTPKDRSEAVTAPVWSPDGAHLLVRRGEPKANDLWIMDLDGDFLWQVTDHPGGHDIYGWAEPVT